MKKTIVLALFALVASISAPLAAAETPVAPPEARAVVASPAESISPTTPATAAVLPGVLPFTPINLSACTDLCLTEYNSCRLDCRFQPYPGCANDCWLEYQACLAGC